MNHSENFCSMLTIGHHANLLRCADYGLFTILVVVWCAFV